MSGYTKDELHAMILNNVNEFNKLIENGIEFDLSEIDFSNEVVESVNFTGSDLTGCAFTDATCTSVNFTSCDLTSADFARSHLTECDFTDAILNGTNYSYATVSYCNFANSDMAGCILHEADLSDSDFSSASNLSACRFDEETIFPNSDLLPDDFDSNYVADLSNLRDDDEDAQSPDMY